MKYYYVDSKTGVVGDLDDVSVFDSYDLDPHIFDGVPDSDIAQFVEDHKSVAMVIQPVYRANHGQAKNDSILDRYKRDVEFYEDVPGLAASARAFNEALDLASTLPLDEILDHVREEDPRHENYPEINKAFNQGLRFSVNMLKKEVQSGTPTTPGSSPSGAP